jgi:hypothetical protein
VCGQTPHVLDAEPRCAFDHGVDHAVHLRGIAEPDDVVVQPNDDGRLVDRDRALPDAS